ncbi:glutamate synthase large subunit [Ureibacillus thermosphaericus]|uniref:Glutamate synthase (NADPH/NADH) large chain/glutamate synthase (Ferredoxin) n=1 Tax=Ureibacillus thermosphaericus TaxID=51173 RepID=A0A840PXV9_URETH|nr:glutamate synthase large subunit [Ureibacillus thermosphaericus]MBB5150164.1 glutamate synthase (NADPH/NADH) large chain/glutamate synthase (ferredoxin) [Ureibacillus thermosphaericus]NKZ32251.1 glutamate synthase large subunit [Ureibacillus thermosphaericus]
MDQGLTQGLYNPQFEHDSCGIALLANIKGEKSHSLVSQALIALERLTHRGGRDDKETLGDGSGILTDIPHELFEKEWGKQGKQLPSLGEYGVMMIFLPKEETKQEEYKQRIEEIVEMNSLTIFGWRTVPTNDQVLQNEFIQTAPSIHQLFVIPTSVNSQNDDFERRLYIARKKIENTFKQFERNIDACYISSFSSKTIVYKGLLLPNQLKNFYVDLTNENYQSKMAMVHNRFSTNTFPSWSRAQPNRMLMHNGEINTITGNVNWMFAREATMKTEVFGDDLEALHPIVNLDGSDSAMFDNVLEHLVMSGWSLPQAMMMMIPEPWQNNKLLSEKQRAFYQYHSLLMEPWDGPAAMGFTNGHQAGACLDRNGLRPARFILTEDDFFYLSSEVGVVDIPEEKIVQKGRLKPGQMLVVDFEKKALLFDEELKLQFINEHPYEQWTAEMILPIDNIPELNVETSKNMDRTQIIRLQRAFGYTFEEWEKYIKPLAVRGDDPVGSMGYDGPLAVLSKKPQLLFNYFKQRFAQVTNPPIDAIREAYVTSMEVYLGSEGNLLKPKKEDYQKIKLKTPILTKNEWLKIISLNLNSWKVSKLSTLFPTEQPESMEIYLKKLLKNAEKAANDGYQLLVISDRGVNKQNAAIPSLLAVSSVHHYLIQKGLRNKVSIIVESGEPREVHHFAALLGYGANAIYPYLVYASLSQLEEAVDNDLIDKYVKGITKGILKIMSKMGISTVQSYIGAQIFEAIGLSREVIENYFPRTISQIGGLELNDIALETVIRHKAAWEDDELLLEEGSDFQWRKNGEDHLYRPETIHTLQLACRTGKYELYKKYSEMLSKETNTTLRGLFELKSDRKPIPIEEVEPIESIFKRFKTGAMSFGSISIEAHEAIAIAMNRIGGKSNSGEGGEDPNRFIPLPNGDSKLSRIKQVASGRFGVTSHYLVNCDEIQIKMAQGAKPGEGGQLAGHKVTEEVAKTRGSTPGIELISPPPHHDIYSIEDLEQLIYDLKNANPEARINVKLVSESGVGTIAAGVAKAKADVILISGYDGGTGAAAKTSIKHAGLPWELGLAEAHQTLMLNGLRNKVVLETDGKLMNGRDVVIAALLGAEEYGFSTLPLVSLGCVMMRVCHLDTCPVGIATQNPVLRRKMIGTAEHVVHLMHFIAQEIREYMAELGFRTIEEMVGRTDIIQIKNDVNWKEKKLDLSSLLVSYDGERTATKSQNHQLEKTLDYEKLIPLSKEALNHKKPVHIALPIKNTNRSVGTMLGSVVSKIHGSEGLNEDTIQIHFTGSAGQSFGAFIPNGITLKLEGEANDYVGKGLSGGKIIVAPSSNTKIVAEENVIIGNAAFYGATSGKAFIRGKAGERFCVRNSGALVVVEGTGDHGCEYMTGGRVVILGEVGKNFAAGMSGGIAYVYSPANKYFYENYNDELVLLETIESEKEIQFVLSLIKEHVQETNSLVAKRIIQNWKKEVSNFIRVIPHKYKQILDEQELYLLESY